MVELSGSGRQGERDRGAAELVAGPPAGEDSSAAAAPSPLHSLSVDDSRATLDLTAMPALASLDICVDELAGSDTLAGATALTHLSIGSTSEPPNVGRALLLAMDKPWVARMLCALPATVSLFCLCGVLLPADWTASPVIRSRLARF